MEDLEKIIEEDWGDAYKLAEKIVEDWDDEGISDGENCLLIALCLVYVGNTKLRLLQQKHHDLEHKFQEKVAGLNLGDHAKK